MFLELDEFRKRLQSDVLRIALVGMSNSGKSTCTRVLVDELGFGFFEVDEAINRTLDIGDMEQAAKWMGYPFDDCYEENKRKYLELEARFSKVEIPPEKNFVLDTTGSVIYADQRVRQWIRDNFMIIGLTVSTDLCQTLIDDYFLHPKTVIWGDEFAPHPGEDGIEAMKRCYPLLLENRAMQYAALADVEIPAGIARDPNLDANTLIKTIETAISARHQ